MINVISHNFHWGQRKSGLEKSFREFLRRARRDLKYFDFVKNIDEMDFPRIPQDFSEEVSLLDPSFARFIFHDNHSLKENIQKMFWNGIQMVQRSLEKDPQSLLINWGGDHSIGISTVLGFLNTYPQGKVIWIDAHGDINTPSSSLTKSLHGMPLAFALNLNNLGQLNFPHLQHFVRPEQLIYLGLRDLDESEKITLDELGIENYSVEDIRRVGIHQLLRNLSQKLQLSPLHVSFDVDAIDPMIIQSTGVPSPNGFLFNEIFILAQWLRNLRQLKSLDIVELNPEIGSAEDLENSFATVFEMLDIVFSRFADPSHLTSFTKNHFNTEETYACIC